MSRQRETARDRPAGGPLASAADLVRTQKAAYEQDEDRPLGSYAGLIGLYALWLALLGVLVRLAGRQLPSRLSAADLALATVATHKASRLLAKDPVTSPVRAPFTEFAGQSGPAELTEEVRGRGARRAVGEMLTCPFCLSLWLATGFAFGLVLAPRLTRLAASVLTIVAGSDHLQSVYGGLEQRAQS